MAFPLKLRWKSRLSATVNSSAESAKHFFRGPQRCPNKFLWGQKWLETVSPDTRHITTLLNPLVVLTPQIPFPLVLTFGAGSPLPSGVSSGLVRVPHPELRKSPTEGRGLRGGRPMTCH